MGTGALGVTGGRELPDLSVGSGHRSSGRDKSSLQPVLDVFRRQSLPRLFLLQPQHLTYLWELLLVAVDLLGTWGPRIPDTKSLLTVMSAGSLVSF